MRLALFAWRTVRHHFLSLDELAALEGDVTLSEAERVAAVAEKVRDV